MNHEKLQQIVKNKIEEMYSDGSEYDRFLDHINTAVVDVLFDDQPERLNPEAPKGDAIV